MSFIVHPSKWEAQHAGAIFAGQAYQSTHDGQLPNTPMWRMLEFRHSLNSARFDFWHPNVGLILEHREPGLGGEPLTHPHGWIGHMRGPKPSQEPIVPVPLPQEIIPLPGPDTTTTGTPPPPPPTFADQAVPEPSAVFQGMTAFAMAFAYLAKRRRNRVGL